MKYSIHTALAVSLCFVALSCSEDTEFATKGGASKALVQTSDFTPTDDFCDLQTRSVINPTSSPIAFSWAAGDQLAVYAAAGTGMTNFDLVSSTTSVATFKASGFNLKGGDTYLAFSPYNAGNTDKTQVAVSYDGMRQEGNATYSHLGAYDYQWAKAVAAGNSDAANINFNFAHAGAICRFQIHGLPSSVRFSSLSITAPGIITKGTIDLTQTTPSIVAATGNSTTQVVTLGTSGISAGNDGTLTVYTMMAPANLAGTGNVTLTLYSGDMKLLSFNVNGKNMVAGKAYAYSATYTAPSPAPSLPANLDYVDLGLQLNGHPVLFANQTFNAQWAEEDPVKNAWGLNWRTPTKEELKLLFDKIKDEYSNPQKLTCVWQPTGVTVKNRQTEEPLLLLPLVSNNDELSPEYTGNFWSSNAEPNSDYAYFCQISYSVVYDTVKPGTGNIGKSSSYTYLPVYVGPVSN